MQKEEMSDIKDFDFKSIKYLPPFEPFIAPPRKWEVPEILEVNSCEGGDHHWLIDEATGPVVGAICKKCGATRTYRSFDPNTDWIGLYDKKEIPEEDQI